MRRKWFRDDGLGFDVMLPGVRHGMLEAAERRLRFELPWLRPTRNATTLAGILLLFGAGLAGSVCPECGTPFGGAATAEGAREKEGRSSFGD